MKKKLVTVFRNSLGKKQTWSLINPDTKKSPLEIRALLERLTRVKLFHKDGADLFHSVESAKYVETIETMIFDTTQEQP